MRLFRRQEPTPALPEYQYDLMQWDRMLQDWPVLARLPMWSEYDLPYGTTWVTPDFMPSQFLVNTIPQDPGLRNAPAEYKFWVVDGRGRILVGGARGVNLGKLYRALRDLIFNATLHEDIYLLRFAMGQWGYFSFAVLSNADLRLNDYFAQAAAGAQR